MILRRDVPSPSLAHIRHVVFDWNGTLLDDCALAIATVNSLLQETGLPPVTPARYRALFRFPIVDFYGDLGFDVRPAAFSALMRAYLARFDAAVDTCALHEGAHATLAALNAAGLTVSVLSASHRETLGRSLRAKGLDPLLLEAVGLDDVRAHGKIGAAQAFASRHRLDPREVLLIGDTDHDGLVAHTLGWSFLCVEHGHQDGARLAPAPALGNLAQLPALLSPAPAPAAVG